MRFAAALAALAVTSCSISEHQTWLAWHTIDPTAAETFAVDYADDLSHGRCGRWRDLALEVGWSEDEWPTVNRLMWLESGCQPDAYNPSGATGLMQVMWQFWSAECGGTPEQLFEPAFNLACALHVRHVQGFTAWTTY